MFDKRQRNKQLIADLDGLINRVVSRKRPAHEAIP